MEDYILKSVPFFDSEVLGHFPRANGTPITKKDLVILRYKKAWLNDNIVAIGIDRIIVSTPSIFYVNACQFEDLQGKLHDKNEVLTHQERLKRTPWACRLEKSKVNIISVCIRTNHWIVIVIFNNAVFYIDPLNGGPQPYKF